MNAFLKSIFNNFNFISNLSFLNHIDSKSFNPNQKVNILQKVTFYYLAMSRIFYGLINSTNWNERKQAKIKMICTYITLSILTYDVTCFIRILAYVCCMLDAKSKKEFGTSLFWLLFPCICRKKVVILLYHFISGNAILTIVFVFLEKTVNGLNLCIHMCVSVYVRMKQRILNFS